MGFVYQLTKPVKTKVESVLPPLYSALGLLSYTAAIRDRIAYVYMLHVYKNSCINIDACLF